MKAFKRIAAFMMAVMLSLFVFSEYIPMDNNPSQVEATGYSCLAPADDGNWYLFEDGAVNWGYSGLFCDANVGWWLVDKGRVAFEYNDLYGDPNYGWWLITGGAVNSGYTDLFCSPQYGWWLINGGAVACDYNDLFWSPQCGWWLITGGAVNFGYTDLFCSPQYGWWLVNGGTVDFGYNDLFCSPQYGWWLVNGGTVDYGYNDLFCSPQCGWWLVTDGAVNFGYNGVFNSPQYGDWQITGGAVDFGANDTPNTPTGPSNIENTDSYATIEADMKLNGRGSGYHAKLVFQTATSAVSFGIQHDEAARAPYTGLTYFLCENVANNGPGGQNYSYYNVVNLNEWHKVMMTYTQDGTVNLYIDGNLVATQVNTELTKSTLYCSVEGSARLEGDYVDAEFRNIKIKGGGVYDPDRGFNHYDRPTNAGITIDTSGFVWSTGDVHIYGSIVGIGGADWDSAYDRVSGVATFSNGL